MRRHFSIIIIVVWTLCSALLQAAATPAQRFARADHSRQAQRGSGLAADVSPGILLQAAHKQWRKNALETPHPHLAQQLQHADIIPPRPSSAMRSGWASRRALRGVAATAAAQQAGLVTPAWVPGMGWVTIMFMTPPGGNINRLPPPAAALSAPAEAAATQTGWDEGTGSISNYNHPGYPPVGPCVPLGPTLTASAPATAAPSTSAVGVGQGMGQRSDEYPALKPAFANGNTSRPVGARVGAGTPSPSPPRSPSPLAASPSSPAAAAVATPAATGRPSLPPASASPTTAVPGAPQPVAAAAAAVTNSSTAGNSSALKPAAAGNATRGSIPPGSPPAVTSPPTLPSSAIARPLSASSKTPAATPPKVHHTGPQPAVNTTAMPAAGAALSSNITQIHSRPPVRPEGTWQGSSSMVAGAPGSVAISGLTGPEPYVLTQPGAQKTLHLGCLLARGRPRPTQGQSTLDLTHEAMKLALRDLLPSVKPAVNVKLTCYETQCGEMSAVNAMRLFVEQGAEAVVGNTCSTDSVAAAHIAEMAKIPLMSAASSSPQLTGMPFFSRTVFSDRYGGAAAAKLARDMGMESVGMLIEDNAFSKGVSFYFMASFSARGGNMPEMYTFETGQGDAQAAVAQMLKGKAEGLDGIVIATNSLSFYKDFLRAADKAKLDLPVLAPGGTAQNSEAANLLKDNLGLLGRVTLVVEGQGSKEFQARLKAAVNNRDGLDKAVTGHAYDAVNALLKAYAAAPEPKSGVDIAAQVPKQRFEGVTGPVEFDALGDRIPHNSSYVKGTFDAKTGKLQFGEPLQW